MLDDSSRRSSRARLESMATELRMREVSDDEEVLRENSASEYHRSIRDVIWYSGQIAVNALVWHEKRLGIYFVLALIAVVIAGITARDTVKWRRVLARSPRTGRRAPRH